MKNDIWTDVWYENGFLIPYLKQFKKYLPNNPRVLDLGCNSGYNSRRMKDLGSEVIGLDFSSDCIDIAKEKNPDIDFFQDDMCNNLDYLGKFDGVMAIGSLIHIKVKDLEIVFNNIYNILNDDGYLLLVNRNKKASENENSINELYKKLHNREIFAHQREIIDLEMDNKFIFVEELIGDDNWNFLVYKKTLLNKCFFCYNINRKIRRLNYG